MALWAQVQELKSAAARCTAYSSYGISFPIKAREHMAEWIEASIPDSVDLLHSASQNFEASFQTFVDTFEAQINALAVDSPELLSEVIEGMKKRYKENPLAIYKFLCHSVSVERFLVRHFSGNPIDNAYNTHWGDVGVIVEMFDTMAKTTDECRRLIGWLYGEVKDITALEVVLETIRQPADQRIQISAENLQQRVQEVQQLISARNQRFIEYEVKLLHKIQTNITELSSLQEKVLKEKLNQWKSHKEGGANGSFNEGMDTIQLWCEELADLIWEYRNHLKSAERLEQNSAGLGLPPNNIQRQLEGLRNQLGQLLSTLVKSSFIVETQPPQVVKTGTKFTASVRSLIGGRRHLVSASQNVIASILSEADARAHELPTVAGQVTQNVTKMIFDEDIKRLAAEFSQLCVTNIQREDGVEASQQKYYLKFETTFFVEGDRFDVCTLSLPIIVIVYNDQELKSWGTIVWDNVFRARAERVQYEVEESTPWQLLAQSLSRFFAKETGRYLTQNNIQFLKEKYLASHPQESYGDDILVHWVKFFNDPVSILVNGAPVTQEFCLWEWFFTIMKLTKDYLRDHWTKGRIEGFISKPRAEELLRVCQDKTYLLRFTDSLQQGTTKTGKVWKGFISIVWVDTNDNKQQTVRSLQPFTITDLEARPLSDLILACGNLAAFLYPNTPTRVAFQTPVSKPANGYVPIVFQMSAQIGTSEAVQRDAVSQAIASALEGLEGTSLPPGMTSRLFGPLSLSDFTE